MFTLSSWGRHCLYIQVYSSFEKKVWKNDSLYLCLQDKQKHKRPVMNCLLIRLDVVLFYILELFVIQYYCMNRWQLYHDFVGFHVKPWIWGGTNPCQWAWCVLWTTFCVIAENGLYYTARNSFNKCWICVIYLNATWHHSVSSFVFSLCK